MKTCKHPFCTNPVWGGGYCKSHQYLRNKIRSPMTRKPVKAVSSKRKEQKKEYLLLKEEAVAEARKKGPIMCFACNKEITGFVDWHHLDGREESKLLDTSMLVFMHREHHNNIHDLSIDNLKKRAWYENIYLKNLKDKNPNLYDREISKAQKILTGNTDIPE